MKKRVDGSRRVYVYLIFKNVTPRDNDPDHVHRYSFYPWPCVPSDRGARSPGNQLHVRLVRGRVDSMNKPLSEQAKRALRSAPCSRQGAVPTHPMNNDVVHELISNDLLGPGHGLTRKGTIAYDRLMDELMEF